MSNKIFKLFLNSEVKLAEPKVENGTELKRFKILGYTGKPVNLMSYGVEHPVVYNVEGITVNSKIPYLLDHYQPIGHVENIRKEQGTIVGDGVHSYPNAQSLEVAQAIENGVPFQSSMGLDISESDVTFVAEGVVSVNNQTFEAPIYVVNKSTLVEQTATLFGRDSDTEITTLSKDTMMRIKNGKGAGNNDPAPKGGDKPSGEIDNKETPTTPNTPTPPEKPQTPVGPTNNGLSALEIIRLSKLAGDDEDCFKIIENGAKEGWDEDRISESIRLHKLEKDYPVVPNGNLPQDKQKVENNFTARLALSFNVSPEFLETKLGKETVGQAFDQGNFGLRELITVVANSNGGSFNGHSDIEDACKYIKRLNNNQQYSNIVFPNLLERVTQFSMEEHWSIGKPWSVDHLLGQSQSSFKPTGRIRPSGGQMWDQLDKDGRIQHGSFGEEKTYLTYLKTIAQILTFKREDIINDDLGVIEEMMRMMVEGATMVPDFMFVQKLYNGIGTFLKTSKDNVAFGAPAAFDRDSLKIAYDKVRRYSIKKGDKEVYSNFNTKWKLVIPQALEQEAFEILQQSRVVSGTDDVVGSQNYWYKKLEITVFDNLDNTTYHAKASDDVWGIVPVKQTLAPYSISYLNNQRRPTTEAVDLPADMLGMGIRGFWDLEVNEREEEATFWNFPSEVDPDA